MPSLFSVDVVGFTDLEELPGSWTAADFARLLARMEVDDVAGLEESELREMCVMSLQDREPAAAAALLLEHRLGDALTKGQIQNISHEMCDEKLWEEYADMPLHERLFHVASLLYQAFPRSTPQPDAVEVELRVTAQSSEAERVLAAPLGEALLVRLLADGMPAEAALHRLFSDALAGARFPEAESIVWSAEVERDGPRSARVRLLGPGQWFDPLRTTKSFESDAHADA